MPLPEDFPAYLLESGFHYVNTGLWARMTGGGLFCVVYSGNGEWIVQNKNEMLTGLTAEQVYGYIEGTKHKKPGD